MITAPAADVQAERLSSAAFRWLAAGALAVVLISGNVRSLNLLVIAVLATVSVDTRNLPTLKNFFLLYMVVVFGLGVAVFHLASSQVLGDVIWYLAAFLGAYALASLRQPPASQSNSALARRLRARLDRRGPLHPTAVEASLKGLVVLNLLFLAWQISRYGLVGFYQGQALLEQFQTYGKASASGGLEQIVRFFLKFGAIGLSVLYVQTCFEARRRIHYRYPIGLLVVLPIVLLRRYDAISGAAAILAVYACDRRVGVHSRRAGSARPGAVMMRVVMIGGAVVAALIAAFVIGLLRQSTLVTGPTPNGTVTILTSELYAVQAYGEIRANPELLGRQGGKTIIGPLLLKVIPRAWLPGKPLNSGGYYMSVLHPREFAASFALPPTFFGDALLSFGFSGAVLASLALGFVASRLDMGFRRGIIRRIPLFLMIFASFYPLLREPLSESLAGILLTLGVWGVGNRVFRTRPAVQRRAAVNRQRAALNRQRAAVHRQTV